MTEKYKNHIKAFIARLYMYLFIRSHLITSLCHLYKVKLNKFINIFHIKKN